MWWGASLNASDACVLHCTVHAVQLFHLCVHSMLLCRHDGPRESFHHSLEALMPGVNLAFFSLAGASLKLDALGQAAWLASVICGFRVLAIFGGSHVGCWLSGCPQEHRKRMWQAMMTQVGHTPVGLRCEHRGLVCATKL